MIPGKPRAQTRLCTVLFWLTRTLAPLRHGVFFCMMNTFQRSVCTYLPKRKFLRILPFILFALALHCWLLSIRSTDVASSDNPSLVGIDIDEDMVLSWRRHSAHLAFLRQHTWAHAIVNKPPFILNKTNNHFQASVACSSSIFPVSHRSLEPSQSVVSSANFPASFPRNSPRTARE